MAPQTPTSAEISDNIIAQLQTALNQSIPLLPRAFNRVLAKALGAVFVILYKYGGYIGLMQFVKYAPMEETTINGRTFSPLTEWGVLSGVGEPDKATRAELTVSVAVSAGGAIIPAGSTLFSVDNGYTYSVVSSEVVAPPSTELQVRAIGDPNGNGGLGAIGNLSTGSVLRFSNPPAGLNNEIVVVGTVTQAADAESTEAYRQRIVTQFSAPPQGGALSDYRIWALSVEGIINAYPYSGPNPGEVTVYVEATPASSGNADGIPTAAQLEQVDYAIRYDEEGRATRKPVGAAVIVQPITRTAFDVDIEGLDVPGSAAEVQTRLEQTLTSYFANRQPYIIGLDTLGRRDRITESAVGGVVNDTVSAASGTFDTLDLSLSGGGDLITYDLGQGEKAKLGDITYV